MFISGCLLYLDVFAAPKNKKFSAFCWCDLGRGSIACMKSRTRMLQQQLKLAA